MRASCRDGPSRPSMPRSTRSSLPGLPLAAALSLRESATLSLVAVVAALGSMRVPSLSPPAPPLASTVKAFVASIAPVWSLIVVVFRAPVPLLVSRVAPPSSGGCPSATAALEVLIIAWVGTIRPESTREESAESLSRLKCTARTVVGRWARAYYVTPDLSYN